MPDTCMPPARDPARQSWQGEDSSRGIMGTSAGVTRCRIDGHNVRSKDYCRLRTVTINWKKLSHNILFKTVWTLWQQHVASGPQAALVAQPFLRLLALARFLPL